MILQTMWFLIWGLLWAIFFITGGFDLGVGVLYPFLGDSEHNKLKILHSIGPFWNGNEVWLITAAGVSFAAFPFFYSTMFSALYSPLMIILFALIIRGVSFEFRGQIENIMWKKIWDLAIFISSLISTILFGILFANIFKGIPLDPNGVYIGSLATLLNPYGILGGILFLCFFILHGSLWLVLKTEGRIHIRSKEIASNFWYLLLGCLSLFLTSSALSTELYSNYTEYPFLSLIIAGSIASIFAIRYFLMKQKYTHAWSASAVTIIGFLFFGLIGLFPYLLKSSISNDYSLTVFNSSSSPLTLKIMLMIVIFFIPAVIAYQGWAYNLFKNKISDKEIHDLNSH